MFPSAPGASGARDASGSAAATPSIPRQLATTATGNPFPSATSSVSPRLNLRAVPDAGASSVQIGVSGPPGRKAIAPSLACSDSAGRVWAAVIAGTAGARAVAPKPARRSRRCIRAIGSAIADPDHFWLEKSSRRSYALKGRKRPFFCCERVSPCYKPAAPIAFMTWRVAIQVINAIDPIRLDMIGRPKTASHFSAIMLSHRGWTRC